jgi:nucleotide-binding universal stress UspA family protein
MYKKILLATDGSEHSLKAAKKVVELQKLWNAEVEIFYAENHHVPPQVVILPFPFLNQNEYRIPERDYLAMKESFLEWGRKHLADTKKIFDDAGLKVKTTLAREISPEDYAKNAVKENNIDLVVIGAKGHHSKLRQVFMGSVCERIINEVECDTLMIK